jgi:hypothetical protein
LSSVFEQPQTTKKSGGHQPGCALRYPKGSARGLLHHPVGALPANTSKPTVWRWQERHLAESVDGLRRDKTQPSRGPPLPRETRLKAIAKTVQAAPPNATHWTRSAMAEAVGISPSSIGRIWAEAGLTPHQTRSFMVSNTPLFEEKVTDIVGLCLDPPDRAVVPFVMPEACVQHDEKSVLYPQLWNVARGAGHEPLPGRAPPAPLCFRPRRFLTLLTIWPATPSITPPMPSAASASASS